MSKAKEKRVSSRKLQNTLPWLWFAVAVLVVIFDQWTKAVVSASLDYAERIEITSFFNLTLRYNYGIAFSIFDDIEGGQRWPLVALAAVVSVGVAIWLWLKGREMTLEFCGLAMILGGAVGNLYDRAVLGYVVDFIEVYYKSYYWPAFNIADSAICCGAGLLLIDGFRSKKPESAKA
jgi:signal peptidase II